MPKILLIGWDQAGWDHIHPLLDAGAMPHLARLVENGVMGDLATLAPLCSPLLWTSVATGQFADRHGVLDSVEPDPVTAGVRPATRASLQAPQLWDILASEGFQCQTIGWPVTHPAQGPATCVSNGFAFAIPGSIYPKPLEASLLPLRFDPREWPANDLALFVPELNRIDQDRDKRLAKLAVVLGEAVSVHAAATHLLESAPWDFSAVWFGAIGRASDIFPVAHAGEIYKDVVPGIYRLLDLFLGRLVQLAGPETIVMLVSDRTAGEREWDAAKGRGPRGLLCASGPETQPDELTFGAGLLDIAPTILGIFGFAPSPAMPGRAIPEISATAPQRTLRIAPRAERPIALAAAESLAGELEGFGYTDAVAESWRAEADAARSRREFHLARVLLGQGRMDGAIPLLERLAGANAANLGMQFYLGHAYLQSGRVAECRTICEALLAQAPDSPYAAAARAHLGIAEGNYEDALAHLASAKESYGIVASLDAVVGQAYLRLGKNEQAAAAFRSAIQTDAGIPGVHEGLARTFLALGQYTEAAESALDAIRLRFDQPLAHETLGRALHAMGREQAAAGAFANAEALSRHTVA